MKILNDNNFDAFEEFTKYTTMLDGVNRHLADIKSRTLNLIVIFLGIIFSIESIQTSESLQEALVEILTFFGILVLVEIVILGLFYIFNIYIIGKIKNKIKEIDESKF